MSDRAEETAETAIEVTALRVTPDSDGAGGVTLELRTAEGTPKYHLNSTRAAGLFLDFFPSTSMTCRLCHGSGRATSGNACIQCGGSGQA